MVFSFHKNKRKTTDTSATPNTVYIVLTLPSRPDPEPREKITLKFSFSLSFDASKGFIKPHKTLRHHKELKIKIKLIFILIELSEMHREGKVNFYTL